MKLESALIMAGIVVFLIVGFGVLLIFLFGNFGVAASGQNIAVIALHGELVYSSDPMSGTASTRTLRALFKKANEDSSVAGIILDVNSPGGAVVASREMMRIIKSSEKPVVAWVGDLSASGAYYATSAADSIVVDEDSLVGNIGVASTSINYEKLLEKLGINVTVVKAGEYKDIGSSYRDMTEEEQGRLQQMVDVIHEHFIQDIAENRKMPIEKAREVSNGLVYLGIEAKALGLADIVGGFEDAVTEARRLSDAPDAEVVYLENTDDLEYALFSSMYSAGRGLGDSVMEKMGDENSLKVMQNG